MSAYEALSRPQPTFEHIKTTRKMRWWYESLADFIIANPRATHADMAAHFQRGISTISTIVLTDSFKAYMRKRRDEMAASLDQSVRSKLLNLTDLALDAMIDKVEKKKDTLPISDLQRVTDTTLKALGYTAERPQVVVNNNQPQQTTVIVPVSLEDLQAAQRALRASQMHPMIDVTPEPPVREARQEAPNALASGD